MPTRFIQARHYTPVASREIDLIVVHTMESDEKPDTAEVVANWFAGTSAPQASAHFCIDANSIVQCVHDHDVAWAAPGANHNGLHFEHAGRASQRLSDWTDAYSTAELLRSAELAAKKATLHGIPIRRLTPSQLRGGKRGFVGHIDVTNAFSGGVGHTDPGPNFPWPRYLKYVRAFKAGRRPAAL